MNEQLQQSNRFNNDLGNLHTDIILDPTLFYSKEERTTLLKELMLAVSTEFNGPGFMVEDLYRCVFGIPGRGKVLAITRDINCGIIHSFASGQILNSGDQEPINFQGHYIFHISVIYSRGGNDLPMWNTIIQNLKTANAYSPDFFSCFTQNPRIYSLLRHFSNKKIYPNHTRMNENNSQSIYKKLATYLNGGIEKETGVFNGKAKGSFTLQRQDSKNSIVNDWFYRTLSINPENGDLLLLLGQVPIFRG